MYVISALVKYDFEDEGELRFAGYDRGAGSFSTGEPCWNRPRDINVKYFNTSKEAEDWYNENTEYLTTYCEGTVKGITITEVVYNPVKSLSLETAAPTNLFETPQKSESLADKSIKDNLSRCECTKILINIAEELDKQYALTKDTRASREALQFYEQLYDNTANVFTTVGFTIKREETTGKHTVWGLVE